MAGRSIARFRRALAERGLADTIVELEDGAHTADAAAAGLACPTAAIVKSLVFVGPGDEPVLVLAAGDGRVDESMLAEQLGGPVRLADAGLVREAAGYAIGGVPPFGHNRDLATLIDPRIERQSLVWAAAGTPRALFSLTPAELVRATGGAVTPIRRD